MLYVCQLTHPITGVSNTHFDTRENCETYAHLNNDDFVSEVRPARSDEIKDQISELRRRRKSIQFNYEYSPWSMGPGYRASLARIDSQLLRLTASLDELRARRRRSDCGDDASGVTSISDGDSVSEVTSKVTSDSAAAANDDVNDDVNDEIDDDSTNVPASASTSTSAATKTAA